MDAIQVLKERRSINFFDPDRQISKKDIEEILEVAHVAPSSYNLQPWEVIVVQDPQRKKELRKYAYNQPKVEEASAVVIIIANPGAVEENIDEVLKNRVAQGYMTEDQIERGKQAPFKLYGDKNSLTRKIFAVKNASFFAMSVMIAAKALGFETHPMDGIDPDNIKKAFAISEDKIIPLIIALGFPKANLELKERPRRRPLEAFVRFE